MQALGHHTPSGPTGGPAVDAGHRTEEADMGRHRSGLLGAVVLAALLAGCGGVLTPAQGTTTAPPHGSPTPRFTSLRVVRTDFYGNKHVPAFAETVTQARDIERLYDEIQRLGFAGGSSPISDPGVSYELTFRRDDAVVFTAVVSPFGRPRVLLPDSCLGLSISPAASVTFWPAFFAATGLSDQALAGGTATAPPYAPRPSLPTSMGGETYPRC